MIAFQTLKQKALYLSHRKALMALFFFLGNFATGHLSGNFSPYVPSPGDAGSDDTGLMSV
jgi:hypothetical protein